VKTLKEVLELASEAILQNSKSYKTWFIDYSGHVGLLQVRYYPAGWSSNREDNVMREVSAYTDNEEDLQLAYWFIKKHMR
jgi:hypothetical protein